MQCSYILMKSKYDDWPQGKNGANEVQKTKNVIVKYVVNIILNLVGIFIFKKVIITKGKTNTTLDQVVKYAKVDHSWR